ncbi:MAG: molecular chaperone TorD family protein [Raoultibacter sp.]
MTAQTSEEQLMWQARAVAWELMALSLRYPDSVLVEAVASGQWAGSASEVAAALYLVLPEGWDDGVAKVQDAEALSPVLRAEATHLFVGVPDPACSPYEGVWRAKADGVQALMFVSSYALEVEQFAAACGLGRPEGTNEPLDYAPTECEILQYLASLCAGGAALSGAPCASALPKGSPQAAYDSFLKDHASAWMPLFAEELAAQARQPFYRAVAAVLGAMVKTGK